MPGSWNTSVLQDKFKFIARVWATPWWGFELWEPTRHLVLALAEQFLCRQLQVVPVTQRRLVVKWESCPLHRECQVLWSPLRAQNWFSLERTLIKATSINRIFTIATQAITINRVLVTAQMSFMRVTLTTALEVVTTRLHELHTKTSRIRDGSYLPELTPQAMRNCRSCTVSKSCLTLSVPMDYSTPGSSVFH